MLSTVAVEVVQRGVPVDRARIARPEPDTDDTSFPGATENEADLSRPGPHHDSGRCS